MKVKVYTGVTGELYRVKFLPSYMRNWSQWKINIVSWIFNHLPNKLISKIERILNSRDKSFDEYLMVKKD